jgi:hypothetical protein
MIEPPDPLYIQRRPKHLMALRSDSKYIKKENFGFGNFRKSLLNGNRRDPSGADVQMERLEDKREREDGRELLFCFLLVNICTLKLNKQKSKKIDYKKEYSNVFEAAGSIRPLQMSFSQ